MSESPRMTGHVNFSIEPTQDPFDDYFLNLKTNYNDAAIPDAHIQFRLSPDEIIGLHETINEWIRTHF